MLILRCEVGRGISLDCPPVRNDHWHGGDPLWIGDAELLVPADPALPLLEVAGGLFERKFAPFADDARRAASLDKAYRALADLARRSI